MIHGYVPIGIYVPAIVIAFVAGIWAGWHKRDKEPR